MGALVASSFPAMPFVAGVSPFVLVSVLLIGVPFADIGEAKLTLTDELIEAARAKLPAKALGDGSEWTEETTEISENGRLENG